jgi:hypothetical protein
LLAKEVARPFARYNAFASGLTIATWQVSQDNMSAKIAVGNPAALRRENTAWSREVRLPSGSPIVVG